LVAKPPVASGDDHRLVRRIGRSHTHVVVPPSIPVPGYRAGLDLVDIVTIPLEVDEVNLTCDSLRIWRNVVERQCEGWEGELARRCSGLPRAFWRRVGWRP
jgi:hypothetical protein